MTVSIIPFALPTRRNISIIPGGQLDTEKAFTGTDGLANKRVAEALPRSQKGNTAGIRCKGREGKNHTFLAKV
ncbi:hypothetical protein HYALB_00006149 [Hymenoscyphus albidus]|uniref:Uncharacterized protein n=1 Tax=Hymenoscyphus albidus TaxID=595503 RepID=A0A9N9LNN2_9HELO|nr:hypothetical protein HYALB_00006149 [Hymenoscyphus albidus]